MRHNLVQQMQTDMIFNFPGDFLALFVAFPWCLCLKGFFEVHCFLGKGRRPMLHSSTFAGTDCRIRPQIYSPPAPLKRCGESPSTSLWSISCGNPCGCAGFGVACKCFERSNCFRRFQIRHTSQSVAFRCTCLCSPTAQKRTAHARTIESMIVHWQVDTPMIVHCALAGEPTCMVPQTPMSRRACLYHS